MSNNATIAAMVELPIYRLFQGEGQDTTDVVVQEALLSLSINGYPAYHLLYLPGLEAELCLGFLLTAGVIEGTADIAEMRLLPPESTAGRLVFQVQVRLAKTFDTKRDFAGSMAAAVLAGAPEAREPLMAKQFRQQPPLAEPMRVKKLLDLMASLPDRQTIFQQTGGTHAIFLAEATDGAILAGAEDVGRHNAFDKVIGQALQKNLRTQQALALLSGRASFEMVLKAARAGLPLLASVSAPTSLAIRLADWQGITLIGFARQGRCNIYTHPQRLVF